MHCDVLKVLSIAIRLSLCSSICPVQTCKSRKLSHGKFNFGVPIPQNMKYPQCDGSIDVTIYQANGKNTEALLRQKCECATKLFLNEKRRGVQ